MIPVLIASLRQVAGPSGEIIIPISQYLYWGDPSTNGSWRIYVSGADLVTEKRIAGVWTEAARVIDPTV